MARNATAATPVAKKTRVRKPSYYVARALDNEPVIVVAKSHKDALKAVITLAVATHEDLMKAGKQDWTVINTTVPANQVTLDAKTENVGAEAK